MSNDIWQQLYEITKKLLVLQPWNDFWSNDLICIEYSPEDVVYCTIMGQNGDCFGIAIYDGDSGYEDLCSVSQEYSSQSFRHYVMFEQTCLTLYFGNKNEVPKDQLQMMKSLGMTFKKGEWPFFLSMEARYYPTPLLDEEAKRMLLVLTQVLEAAEANRNGLIDVDFDKEKMLLVHKKQGDWVFQEVDKPSFVNKFEPIELADKQIYKELKAQPKIDVELYLDLQYLNMAFDDEKSMKPMNALLFIVMDAQSQMVMKSDLLKPEDDDIQVILNFLVSFIMNNGRLKTIFVRNLKVYSAIVEICDHCEIALQSDGFTAVDEVLNQMKSMMGGMA